MKGQNTSILLHKTVLARVSAHQNLDYLKTGTTQESYEHCIGSSTGNI
jgi:hypothetical protein